MGHVINITINTQHISVDAPFLDWSLLRFLREELHLTGTKQACDSQGICGLCKVIINGRARISCRQKMADLDGAVIETIENLAPREGDLHPLLQTLIQDGIFQCGYCASGAILSAKALLDQNLNPTYEEIRRALSGTLCRCVGLHRMDHAVQRAAAILRGDVKSTWAEEDTANNYKTIEKLTGQLRYTDDLHFPGMLIAKAYRVQIPHGNLKALDVRSAQRMPGIIKVLTAKDIPGENRFGLMIPDQQVFCEDVFRYAGDTIALVIGETEAQVDAALQAIQVEIEPLPVISSSAEALKKDAPVLHARLKAVYPESPNVLKHLHICKGDPEKGFETADYVYEQTYHVPFVEHAYMETETSIGLLDEEGLVTVYVGSQGPTNDRTQVARVLGVEEGRVRIAHQYIGGGFGGKEDIAGQIHAALAAMITGRPVKVHWNRRESILTSYKRHAAEMHYKMGITKTGKLIAADVKIFSDTGAYASVGEEVLFRMMAFACGPYEIPNVEVHAYAVHTNNNPCGAFRGYGSPQVAFAAEVHLQQMIDALGLDPIETRLMNALDIGKATITGDVLTEDVGAGIVASLKALKTALQVTPMPEVKENEKLGLGIACGYKNVGLGANIPDNAEAQVSLEKDGKFMVRHGAADMGQGSEQVVAEITSRVLGVPLAHIKVHTGDTHQDPLGGMTTASRATFITGNAVQLAATGLRKMLWEWVSQACAVDQADLAIVKGFFINKSTGENLLALGEIAAQGRPWVYQAYYEAPKTQAPQELIPAYPDVPQAPLHFAYDFGAQAAIVGVNQETGAVKVHKIIAAHDCGAPLIYQNVIGQIEGAVVQGMGYALSEEFKIEDGLAKSTRLRDLGLLRFHQIPEIIPIIIEDPHPKGPFGAKGVGELALTPTAPAIVNAIHDAVGVWIRTLPATKERVLDALREQGEDQAS